MSQQTALNKNLISRLIAELPPNQVLATSSTSSTIGSRDSDPPASTLSDVNAILRTGLSQFQAVAQISMTRAAAITAIEKDMFAARQLALSLLLCRNALAPISALPPELLARIFHFLALWVPPCSYGTHRLGWIVVTHVCQRWRQVALDDSSLWARISGSKSSRWIAEMLVRARSTLLVADFEDTPYPKSKILTMIAQHISHTRELWLPILSLDHSRAVQKICGSEAPELEEFELGISALSPLMFHRIAGTTLFKGRTPKLRSLSLSQVLIPWSLIPRGQLTQLNITLFKNRSTHDLRLSSSDDLNQLVDLLINSPQLQVLILEFCLPTMLSQISHGQPIHLPCLSRLCLRGPTSHITNLLRRLTIPSSASLRLRCISEPSPIRNDHLILPLISEHFYHPAPVEFKSFQVTANYMEGLIEVVASISLPRQTTSHSCVLKCDMDCEPELFLSFNGLHEFGPSNQPYQANILGEVCSSLPILNVEFLFISAFDTTPFANWGNLFRHCTKVTTLQARGNGTCSLLQSLAPLNTPSGSKGKKWKEKCGNRIMQAQAANNVAVGSLATTVMTTPFPKLTSLLLQNLDFSIAVPQAYPGVLYDLLISTLEWRKMNMLPGP